MTLKTASQSCHMTSGSWWCITTQSFVRKVWAVHKIQSGPTYSKHRLFNKDILNFWCDLHLVHNNPTSPQDTQAYDDVPLRHVWSQKDKQVIVIIWALAVTLTFKVVNHSFSHITLWLITRYQHTKFDYKIFSSSEDIVRTNIHQHLEPSLWPWSWMQQSIFFFFFFFTLYSSLWWCTIKPSLTAKGPAVQEI